MHEVLSRSTHLHLHKVSYQNGRDSYDSNHHLRPHIPNEYSNLDGKANKELRGGDRS